MKKLMLRSLGQSGTTLVDLVVALAVMSMAVASAGALATTASRTGSEAGRRTQATDLAGREMEALHNYRDSIMSSGQPWSNVIPASGAGYNPATHCANFVMQRTSTGWSLL